MTVTAVEFSDLSRVLGAKARDLGLIPPSWKNMPPEGIRRTIIRGDTPASTIVKVQLVDRDRDAVVDDMVDGILVANDRTDCSCLRTQLKEAVEC